MTRAQKLWYSYLFGTTYQSSLAWIFYQHFPEPMSIDWGELDKWNRATMPRQRFGTDTRYNKGHVVRMWRSFVEWVEKEGGGDIEEAFDKFLVDDPTESYHNINAQIRTWFKFGRMTSWLTAQCLYEGAGLPIAPDTMFTDDPGNQSVWNGTCYFWSMEHMTVGKQPKFAGYKPTSQDRSAFLKLEKELMAEAQDRISSKEDLSYFTLETHLCQFKKLNVGYDYPGQNVGDAVNRYREFARLWPEVDFSAMAEVIDGPHMFEVIRWHRESKALFPLFQKTGQPINMHNLYPDLPDMSKELGLESEHLLEEGFEGVVAGKVEDYARRVNGGPSDALEMFT